MTDSKQSPEKPWEFPKGKSGNPGGLTSVEREARDAVRQALSGELREVGLAAYRRLLEADNAPIVIDFMNRLAGKVKERVEVTGEEGASVLGNATLEQLLELVRSGK